MPFTLVNTSFELPAGHIALLRVSLTAQGEKTLRLLLETSSPTGHSRTQWQHVLKLDDRWTTILFERGLPLGYEPGTCSVILTGTVEDGGDLELHPDVRPENILDVEIVDAKNVEYL